MTASSTDAVQQPEQTEARLPDAQMASLTKLMTGQLTGHVESSEYVSPTLLPGYIQ